MGNSPLSVAAKAAFKRLPRAVLVPRPPGAGSARLLKVLTSTPNISASQLLPSVAPPQIVSGYAPDSVQVQVPSPTEAPAPVGKLGCEPELVQPKSPNAPPVCR